jgi:hypothetical protein
MQNLGCGFTFRQKPSTSVVTKVGCFCFDSRKGIASSLMTVLGRRVLTETTLTSYQCNPAKTLWRRCFV